MSQGLTLAEGFCPQIASKANLCLKLYLDPASHSPRCAHLLVLAENFPQGLPSLFSDGLCAALEMASVDLRDSTTRRRTDERNNLMFQKKMREMRVWVGKACVPKADMDLGPRQAHLKS